jgi:hypothetical protein
MCSDAVRLDDAGSETDIELLAGELVGRSHALIVKFGVFEGCEYARSAPPHYITRN